MLESGTRRNIVVAVRPIVVQIEIPDTRIRRVVPIAEAYRTHSQTLPFCRFSYPIVVHLLSTHQQVCQPHQFSVVKLYAFENLYISTQTQGSQTVLKLHVSH